MSRIPVAVVGATGLAGQQFLASLAGHPELEVRKLAASPRSAGKKYADAVLKHAAGMHDHKAAAHLREALLGALLKVTG